MTKTNKNMDEIKEIKRIEDSDIGNIVLLGILKDRLLRKVINVSAWPGNYLDNKSLAFPIGVQFLIDEDIKSDLVLQITEDGIWQVCDKDAKNRKEVVLSEATRSQLLEELQRRNK